MGGVLKIGDWLYGSGTVKPLLLAINATTGQLTDSLKIGSGAIISADNMLYYYTQKGDMMLLSYNKGKIEKVSSELSVFPVFPIRFAFATVIFSTAIFSKWE